MTRPLIDKIFKYADGGAEILQLKKRELEIVRKHFQRYPQADVSVGKDYIRVKGMSIKGFGTHE